jgi:hypothetical protein
LGLGFSVALINSFGVDSMIGVPVSSMLSGLIPGQYANGLATGLVVALVAYVYLNHLDETIQQTF